MLSAVRSSSYTPDGRRVANRVSRRRDLAKLRDRGSAKPPCKFRITEPHHKPLGTAASAEPRKLIVCSKCVVEHDAPNFWSEVLCNCVFEADHLFGVRQCQARHTVKCAY